ncbi:aa3-type cytochrome c oxidase subunit IV [Roseobacteraceae bacterium S113]
MADDHKHGEMDISVQEKTFEGFINVTVKSVIAILVAVVFLALIGA